MVPSLLLSSKKALDVTETSHKWHLKASGPTGKWAQQDGPTTLERGIQITSAWWFPWQPHQTAPALCPRPPPSLCVCVVVGQSCLTLCNPMDCSPPGSSVHGISQARILEWVAIPFSKGSSWPRDSNLDLPHCRQILYHLSHQGSPQ